MARLVAASLLEEPGLELAVRANSRSRQRWQFLFAPTLPVAGNQLKSLKR
jgi:hypothetical protein